MKIEDGLFVAFLFLIIGWFVDSCYRNIILYIELRANDIKHHISEELKKHFLKQQ